MLAKCVNNPDFSSLSGKSSHQLWAELCELLSKNPTKITSLNVDAIIRGGLRRYTDQVKMEEICQQPICSFISGWTSVEQSG